MLRRKRRRQSRRTAVEQRRFAWAERKKLDNQDSEIEIDPETTEAVIALMARLLIALVRAGEEAGDER
jgi:hypothetical protein